MDEPGPGRRPPASAGWVLGTLAVLVGVTALTLGLVLDSMLGIGFASGGLAIVLGMALLAPRLRRWLREVADAAERLGRGDLSAEVPVAGPAELRDLADAVNRMRDEVAARLASVRQDRATRDAILGRLEEAVVLFDESGDVRYQNPSALRLLGPVAAARSLAPSGLREALAPTGRGTPGQRTVRVQSVIPGLGERTLEAVAVGVPGSGRALLVVRDVTEALAVDAMRRDFVANASHELKTPAASIRALSETIAAAARDDLEALPRFAAQLEHEASRLARIISDLLDLSRLEGEPPGHEDVRLDRIAADEAARLQERATEAGLRLDFRSEGPATVRGSPRDLGLMVRNLVQNAIQYTRPGGRVEVRVGPVDGHAELAVRDTGIGIPARDQGRVFERFYRVDRARSRETGGTGLGLSIVKHVTEGHGGSVWLESRLGVGSTFTVRLPMATDRAG